MKKFRELSEAVKDKFDIGEYDQEGDMAKSDLRSIIANAQKMHDMLDDADNLPEWVQSKITKAEDYISTVANYMAAEMNEEWSKTGKEATHRETGEKTYEYHEVDKEGKPTGKREYRNAQGKSMGEEVEQIDEISSDMLRRAKHKAYGLSAAADQAGKTKEADKRFSQGIRFQNREYDVSKKEGEKFSKYMAQKEEVENLEEKNVPTSPEKWAQAKAQAKAKFDVYPSAYANGWAAKKYKAMGGGWKSVSEAKDDLPFDPDPTPRKKSVVVGKKPEGYSTARHLARMAMQKQAEKMKKPVKESLEESRKAEIVKEIMKKKKGQSENAFQKDPELSSTLTKTQ